MVYKWFDKKSTVSAGPVAKTKLIWIRKELVNCKNQLFIFHGYHLEHWSFWYAIIKLIQQSNTFLLRVIDVYSKNAWVISLKMKKVKWLLKCY